MICLCGLAYSLVVFLRPIVIAKGVAEGITSKILVWIAWQGLVSVFTYISMAVLGSALIQGCSIYSF